MSEEATATMDFSDATKELGDKIVEMTLKEAKELSDYLEDVHGIKPAAGGGAVMMAGPADAAGGGAAEEVQTEFDVVLENFGERKNWGHQGSAGNDQLRPQRGQRTRRRSSQQGQGRSFQRGRGSGQSQTGGSGCHGIDQIRYRSNKVSLLFCSEKTG